MDSAGISLTTILAEQPQRAERMLAKESAISTDDSQGGHRWPADDEGSGQFSL